MKAVRVSSGVLDRLERLERDGASWDDVLGLAVDLLTERGARLGPHQGAACGELMAALVPAASPRARRSAAHRLARLEAAPSAALLPFAREPIEIAAPVLLHSQALDAADLVDILRVGSPAHMRAVAQRAQLPETLTTLLLLRGDRDALVACLGNGRARLSRAAFASLAGMAAADTSIREALVGRADLPDEIADTLWNLADGAGRARLLVSGSPFDEAHAQDILREAAYARASPRTAAPGAEGVATGDIGDIAESARRMAEAAGIAPALALNLACNAYERGAVLLARAARLDEWTFMQLVCRRADFAANPTAPQRMLRLFREVGAEKDDMDLVRRLNQTAIPRRKGSPDARPS